MILVVLALYIVGANVVLYNLSGKISVRLSEIASIILLIFLMKELFAARFDRSIVSILLWGAWSLFLIFVNTAFIYHFRANEVLEGLLFLFRFLFCVILAYLSARFLKQNGLKMRTLKWVNLFYLLVCAIGIVQLIAFPVAQDWYNFCTRFHTYWEGDPHVNRVISTYFDPNYMSSCLTVGFTVNLYLLKKNFSKQHIGEIVGRLLIAVFYFVTVLLSKSRSGFAGFLIIAFLFVALSINYRRYAVEALIGFAIALVAGVALFLFSDIEVIVRIRTIFSDQSAYARVLSWETGFHVVLDTSFLGVGYNLYGAYGRVTGTLSSIKTGYGNDSSLLLILATTGLPGFILFIVHMLSLLRGGDKKEKICLFVAILLICNFNNLLFYSPWVFPFYTVVYLFSDVAVRESARKQYAFARIGEVKDEKDFG